MKNRLRITRQQLGVFSLANGKGTQPRSGMGVRLTHRTGQHRANITDASAQIALRYWFFCEVFYTITTSIFKIAIGLFLLRITIVPVHIWIIRAIMAIAAVVGVAYTSLVIF